MRRKSKGKKNPLLYTFDKTRNIPELTLMKVYQGQFALIITFCPFTAFFQRNMFFFELFFNIYFKKTKC